LHRNAEPTLQKLHIIDEYTQQVNEVFTPSIAGLQMGMMLVHETTVSKKARSQEK